MPLADGSGWVVRELAEIAVYTRTLRKIIAEILALGLPLFVYLVAGFRLVALPNGVDEGL